MPIPTLTEFLRGGGSVCPFAKHTTIHYVADGNARDLRIAMHRLVRRESLAVVANRDTGDFAETKEWAIRRFASVHDTALSMTYASVLERLTVMAQVTSELRDPRNQTRRYIALRNRPLITICMAPVYPIGHPRYAPVTCIISTWMDDIRDAGIPVSIRKAMVREHGSLYDANELVLELPNSR